MKAKEIREFSVEELQQKVKDLKLELFNLKLQKTLGQLTDTSKITNVRRDIARINTVLTEKK